MITWWCCLLLLGCLAGVTAGAGASDVTADLRDVGLLVTPPPLTGAMPGPGLRVRQVRPEYVGTEVYHTLYLPTDWQVGRRYPVVVEYPGNGPFENAWGDRCSGLVDDCHLGYGVSDGRGVIWLCLPFVNAAARAPARQWWGDVAATLAYCRTTVHEVCERYGGDPGAVVLAGFSRGAIACNYIGLHDDAIADTWLAFIAHSHYDGVRQWSYADSVAAARQRLGRLRGRAQFISQEPAVTSPQDMLAAAGADGAFTFVKLGYRNHRDDWVLRDTAERRALQRWWRRTLRERPGTYTVRGRVTDADGAPVADVRVISGAHWTVSAADGCYVLAGLTGPRRTVAAARMGWRFEPALAVAPAAAAKRVVVLDITATAGPPTDEQAELNGKGQ